MEAEIDTLREEKKDATNRAYTAIKIKHAQRYQFHKYIAQLYNLYTPKQKEKAKKVSKELKERIIHIERTFLGQYTLKKQPHTYTLEKQPHTLKVKTYYPLYSPSSPLYHPFYLMGEQRTGMSELHAYNILKNEKRLEIINEGIKEKIRIEGEKKQQKKEGKLQTTFEPKIKISDEKLQRYIKKETERLHKEIGQHKKCKCGNEEYAKGLCRRCYNKNHREKHRKQYNQTMKKIQRERAITIPLFGKWQQGKKNKILLTKEDACLKNEIQDKVEEAKQKVFDKVLKDTRKFLDKIEIQEYIGRNGEEKEE